MERFKTVCGLKINGVKEVGLVNDKATLYLLDVEGMQDSVPAIMSGEGGDMAVQVPKDWQGFLPQSIDQVEEVDWVWTYPAQDEESEDWNLV